MAVGALPALANPMISYRLTSVWRKILAWGGIGALVVAAFIIDSDVVWPGPLTLLPVLGTLFLIAAGSNALTVELSETSIPSKLLSQSPMVWIGGLSYSIYLWHWPLLVLPLCILGH